MSDALVPRSDTRARVIEVAARLLQEHGPSAVTTRGVADAAGVQAPTLYRLFGDKEGLLDAVAEHVLATFVSTKTLIVDAAIAADVDPLDELRSAWDAQIAFGLANPALFRLMNDPERGLNSPSAQVGLRVLHARIRRVAMTGRLRVSERRAVDLIRAAGPGAVLTILSTPPEHRELDLADEIYEAVLRQILTDGPERQSDDEKATTVAFRAIAPQLDALSDSERRLLTEWLDRAISAL